MPANVGAVARPSCSNLPTEITAHFTLEFVIAGTAIALNALIIYFVIFKTPREMKDYRYFLFMISVRSSEVLVCRVDWMQKRKLLFLHHFNCVSIQSFGAWTHDVFAVLRSVARFLGIIMQPALLLPTLGAVICRPISHVGQSLAAVASVSY